MPGMPRHPAIQAKLPLDTLSPRRVAFDSRRFGLSTGRRRLLVVDDSPTVQKVISLTFEDEGVEVVAAGDGAEALRILQAGPPPDVLLADVLMPGPDGYELCERVKRDPRLRHVPVVLLVGKFEPFNEAEARRVGADTVLTKPFQSIRDLVSKVGSLIGGEPKEAERAEELHDEPAARPAARGVEARREAEAESEPARPTRGATTPLSPEPERPQAAGMRPAPAAAEETTSRAPEVFQSDPSSSFADLGVDDEMIEARPAEAFGPRGHSPARPEPGSPEFSSSGAADSADSADHLGARAEAPFGGSDFEPRGPQEAAAFEPERAPSAFAPPPAPFVPQAVDEAPQAGASAREAQQVFAARAAAAATADDALLDLGGFGSSEPASARVNEADDFILDLDDEPADSSSAPRAAAPAAQPDASDFGLELGDEAEAVSARQEAPQFDRGAATDFVIDAGADSAFGTFDEPADSRVDEAGAFAEAAHGETAAGSEGFGFDLTPASADAEHDPAVAREVVAEDVPPRFDSFELRDEPLDFGDASPQEDAPDFPAFADSRPERSAPRGFVEPTVVPADEPVASGLGGEFVDGSVEGDLPRPPAFAAPAAGPESFGAAEAGAARLSEAAAEVAEQPTASVAGRELGEARAGFDARPRAGNLSPEDVEAIARRIVELMSDSVIREIAWEVVPELAELHIRRRLEEERGR